jgi:hypothetical protein
VTLADRVTVPDGVMARQVGEQTVILDLASGTYFGLDEVGTHAWRLLEQGRSLEEVCAAIEAAYDAPRAEIERDLLELVAELEARNLVRRAAD